MLRSKEIYLCLLTCVLAFCWSDGATSATDQGAAITYLQSSFGLSPDQAQERLSGEREAAQVRRHAIELLGDEFAGSWYDAELNKLVIAVVDKRQYSIIEAIGGVPEFREYSLSELSRGGEKAQCIRKVS